MTTYRETDDEMVREYSLELEPIFRKETERALIEMVPTKQFGRAFFIDGTLQFTEKDEYIYHEALVHPCLSSVHPRRDICIMGGGDGCAAREVLKWGSDVSWIHIIDWDKEVTDLFKETYADMNDDAFHHTHVTVENTDIRELLHEDRLYDCIIIDLLDPNPAEAGQEDLWYDVLFMAKHWIQQTGCVVMNAGRVVPWNMEVLEWLITLIEKKFKWPIHLYKTFVPSFGFEWCFILLQKVGSPFIDNLPPDLRYMSKTTWKQMYSYGWTRNYRRNLCLNIEHQIVEQEDE